jgi:HAD superfamily hydrolase (TIGR01509 family)
VGDEKRIRFLFDLGNVLIRCDMQWGAAQIAKQATEPAEVIRHGIIETDLIDAFDQGTFSKAEFHRELAKRFGWSGTPEELELIWQRMLIAEPEMLAILEELQSLGYETYILSNINPFHTEYVRTTYPQLQRTTGMIFSCECRLIKPDVAIFHHTIETLGIDAADTLFIDDRLTNIEAAKSLGFQTLHHTNKNETLEIIRAIIERSTPYSS